MKIVIAGGGFAGLNLSKKLVCKKDFHVTLVDTNNYHFFPPLVYQVSTAFIEPSNISYPFRKMFQGKTNFRYYMGTVINIDVQNNIVETDTGNLEYDVLVLAMGTETNYFGIENMKKQALPMKTIDDALNFRNTVLLNIEKVIRLSDGPEREKLQNIVIAGGGPTGVEISGMLAEMRKNILRKDYPELTNLRGKIYLIDAGPSLLGAMSKKSQAEAYKVLNKLGVTIVLNTAVKDYVNQKVILANGETIPSSTVVWASGVIAREAPGIPQTSIGRGRRILVDEFNRVKDCNNIFAIGDICYQASDPDYPNGHPQLAQVAIQQGKLLGNNLQRLAAHEPMQPFRYHNKGSMAIIAKYKAVVDLPKGFFKGFLAWLVWLFIHLIPIAGFRNKLKLAYNWLWSFLTNDPTLRLIIRPRKEAQQILKEKVTEKV
ncbi:MAG: NAD(P)/FAD-dependent oxidoreductase [Chitinophagaceae bacterium]|nr:NAD(P)/FAD-dependent oxidoreductase [Chitinophagaceae bacterium]